jgi:DNA-binding transcriptional ArsR family regulator
MNMTYLVVVRMEETAFLKKTGNSALMKVLEFFIEGRELDYAKQDIAESTGLARQTVYKIMDELMKKEYVLISRKAGKTNLYKLNKENKYVEFFIEIYDLAIKEEIRKHKSK